MSEPSSQRRGKQKLRTAAEVINRIKWSFNEDDGATEANTVMGYDCRINGPLEKCVEQYTNINEGGDIPEHRIQYFRRTDIEPLSRSFLWDRLSRMDKLFNSGEGAKAPLSPVTFDNARRAQRTMQELAEKRAILAEEKAKRRARQQAAKALAARRLNAAAATPGLNTAEQEDEAPGRNDRHTWRLLGHFHSYDAEAFEWMACAFRETASGPDNANRQSIPTNIKFLTWNVLFDLQRNEQNELVQGDGSLLGDGDNTLARWRRLVEILGQEDADVIALQEATPRFLELLLSQEWVQRGYSSSASVADSTSLKPYGNLIIWRRQNSAFLPIGVHLCRDVGRNRAVLLSLQQRQGTGTIFNVANVHLPADQRNQQDGTTRDRTMARQKELGAVLAKLQVLEQQQQRSGAPFVSVPVVLGDFNSGDSEPDLLQTGIFTDCWKYWAETATDTRGDPDRNGFTFDWKTNRRADRTRQHGHSERPPRRIDRICVGGVLSGQSELLRCEARVVGRDDGEEFPPSDHYGVSVDISVRHSSGVVPVPPILCDPSHTGRNTWAANASPTTESLLALVLRDGFAAEIEGTRLSDASSTLPIPHVTLLNGFVDISSRETAQLAAQAVADVVKRALYSENPAEAWSLPIAASSLTLFEHRASATMVCVPDITSEEGAWLGRLYGALRSIFPNCHEQESRFAGGWMPHLSLASFPDTPAAANAIAEIRGRGGWVREGEPARMLSAYGIGLFCRDANDRKFYPVTTVPIADCRHKDVRPGDESAFLSDGLLSWSASALGASSVVIQELQRACEYANQKLYGGQLVVSVSTYGSHALGVPLPGISDIDAVVVLGPKNDSEELVRSMSDSQFLNCVAGRLSCLHRDAKTRTRLSSSPAGTALFLLTAKLFPQSPSIDVLLCRTDSSGTPISAVGLAAQGGLRDSEYIRSSVQASRFCSSSDLEEWRVYQGALRVIKLWAVRRQIYGTSSGYLGGGGWAALLVWVLQQGGGETELGITTNDLTKATQQLVAHFFKTIPGLYANSNRVVTISDTLDSDVVERAAGVVSVRGSMSVLAPVSGGDFGRSTTRSTTATIWDEIQRARGIVSADRLGGMENLISVPFRVSESSPSRGRVLALRVGIPQGKKPAEIKAWGTTQALNLTVALEQRLDVRLASQAVKKENSFWYFWGVKDTSPLAVLEDVVSQQMPALAKASEVSYMSAGAGLSILAC